MAAKFIELKEAADLLGVSPDELNDMRLSGEIHGLRDGSSWKFKVDEVERVAEDRGANLSGGSSGKLDDDALDFDAVESPQGSDLHLESEGEVASDSPTAIGSMEDFDDLGVAPRSSASSKEEDDDELGVPEGSSDVSLIPDDDGSGVNLVADSGNDILGGSDVSLESAGTGDLDFEGSDLGFSSDVTLDEDDGKADGPSSGAELNVGDDEELALDDDDELVLEGSGDVTGGSGDTGINLTSPSDSGLNLEEEPLDLAGSSVSSLELPDDDDIIDLDDLDAGSDEATQLRADEDFQLAPSAMAGLDDDEDSGSQVIALEDSEAFEGATTMLEGEEAEPVLGQTDDELEGALEQYESSPVAQPGGAVGYAPAPEASYSIWNVLSLLTVLLILGLTGMLMADLVRNMWTWNETYTASTSVMDIMIKLVGLEP